MKKIFVLIIMLPMMFSYCKKSKADPPDCINNLITNHVSSLFLCETGAQVDEYLFQGKTVYVFDPGNCGADMQTNVYDSNCNMIGALGGFIGNIYINNVRFDQNAIFQKTIWKN
jgi:hypothetical protein